MPGTETPCNPTRCADGVARGASTCDGQGSCAVGPTSACSPYVCGQLACRTDCQATGDCAVGFLCIDGTCVSQGKDGKGNAVKLAGGCGCGQSAGGGSALALGLALLALWVRRRRGVK
jgi:uncharacterized protein (TIGR03382 family)